MTCPVACYFGCTWRSCLKRLGVNVGSSRLKDEPQDDVLPESDNWVEFDERFIEKYE